MLQKDEVLTHKKTERLTVWLSTANSIHNANKVLDSLASNINDSHTSVQCFSIHLYMAILHKIDVPHP
jgi:hypothetical protein